MRMPNKKELDRCVASVSFEAPSKIQRGEQSNRSGTDGAAHKCSGSRTGMSTTACSMSRRIRPRTRTSGTTTIGSPAATLFFLPREMSHRLYLTREFSFAVLFSTHQSCGRARLFSRKEPHIFCCLKPAVPTRYAKRISKYPFSVPQRGWSVIFHSCFDNSPRTDIREYV